MEEEFGDSLFNTAELPVLAYKQQIVDALKAHKVIIVSGETGSGKTTQIPKICFAAGRGQKGVIACTQPRRIATVTVAERVAQEMSAFGNIVGWQHRIARNTPRDMKIKFMTDGILLAEITKDPLLRRYDTIMVDEAHERTLNIDFILGCLKQILPRRNDLKVIISSATLQTSLFSDFFDGAPVLEIPGRTFPVEVRYADTDEEAELSDSVVEAVHEIQNESLYGDVLVFLPGERDIRACKEALEPRVATDSVVLALMGSLPAAEQRRAFKLLPDKRRIILATNVAETSVTIPGIRYVIDSGLARISRYNHRARVKKLHIERISQASAEQRKGRSGRLGPGICIRLYSEEDFLNRPQYTDPEVRRTSLAGLILSMFDWRLGDIESFPFVQPPATSMIREGFKELLELQAIRENKQGTESSASRYSITRLGRAIVRLPLEPRLSRMLLAAEGEKTMRDALVVVSALSSEDPLVRPVDKNDEADKCHAKFKNEKSDFVGILLLWRFFHDTQRPLSRSAARRRCSENFISYRKLLEWEDVHAQLSRMLTYLKIDVNSFSGSEEGLHRSMLSGLLSSIGMWDPEKREYRGANGLRFSIFPGSGLFKKPPKWIMCSELVETSRLFARRAASIEPSWIEPQARHICKYSYHSEYWDSKLGTARAFQRITLYGLVISDDVRSDISRINPELCRSLFIRHALVDGEFPKPVPEIVKQNLSFIKKYIDESHKTRSINSGFDEAMFADYFDEYLPQECVNAPALRKWLAHAPKGILEKLLLSDSVFQRKESSAELFPDHVLLAGRRFNLVYRHNLNEDDDGITCTLEMRNIPLLKLWHSDWLVPGAVRDKVAFMLLLLSPELRTKIAKAPGNLREKDFDKMAETCLQIMEPDRPLAQSLACALNSRCRVAADPSIWDEELLPQQFQIRWRVIDAKKTRVFTTRSKKEVFDFYSELTTLAPQILSNTQMPDYGDFKEIYGVKSMSFPDIPQRIKIGKAGAPIYAFPALSDEGDSVSLKLFSTFAEADKAHRGGVLRLIKVVEKIKEPASKYVSSKKKQRTRMSLKGGLGELLNESFQHQTSLHESPLPPQKNLEADILRGALVSAYCLKTESLPRTAESLAVFLASKRIRFEKYYSDMLRLIPSILADAEECFSKLEYAGNLPEQSFLDIAEQLGGLVFTGFSAAVPYSKLLEYPRYLEAVQIRIERGSTDPGKELVKFEMVQPHWERHKNFLTSGAPYNHAALDEYRWLLEEFRVSVWAQELRTKVPVSAKRLDALWEQVPFLCATD
ncbi:MAG: ATP-dependent RNA helicase HrpA [Lentisphaerae bacterium]|nr:ATP-dependent RNA helicase HrpA [Lentisphaerota bacterium]